MDLYEEKSQAIIEKLKVKAFDGVRKQIADLIGLEPALPQGYNLMGIYYELTVERKLATKFYRMSYFADQTYKPANNNLNRITSYTYSCNLSQIDFGL